MAAAAAALGGGDGVSVRKGLRSLPPALNRDGLIEGGMSSWAEAEAAAAVAAAAAEEEEERLPTSSSSSSSTSSSSRDAETALTSCPTS